jgi:hypothetical protein
LNSGAVILNRPEAASDLENDGVASTLDGDERAKLAQLAGRDGPQQRHESVWRERRTSRVRSR